MSARNACRTYRPLRGGIQIRNESVEAPGTLGLIAVDGGGRLWIVSCYHVLVGPTDGGGPPLRDGEPIFQPDTPFGTPVAHVDLSRAHAELDCAAAAIDPGLPAAGEVLMLGAVREAIDARPGMRVVKCGASTGVTEGIIDEEGLPDRIHVRVPERFPSDFELTGPSDAGAVWLDLETLSPVAMHQSRGAQQGRQLAWGRPIRTVLEALDLRVFVSALAFQRHDIERLEAEVFDYNRASARVLEKAGYTLEARLRRNCLKDGQLIDNFIYARLKTDP